MVRSLLLLLGGLVACSGGTPAPKKLDDKTAAATPPAELCQRYVALASKAMTLDDEARRWKQEKCVGKASSIKVFVPADYTCLVECTYAADTYAVARGCPGKCKSTHHELPSYDDAPAPPQ